MCVESATASTSATITNCYIHDNNVGVAGVLGPAGIFGTSVTIQNCEIFRNTSEARAGIDLTTYGVNVTTNLLTITGSLIHGSGNNGCLVYGVSNTHVIAYNYIGDAIDSGYQTLNHLSFPIGGETYVIGNLLTHGSTPAHGIFIEYGQNIWNPTSPSEVPKQALYVINNTIVDGAVPDALGVYSMIVAKSTSSLVGTAADNLSYGNPMLTRIDPALTQTHNLIGAAAWFTNAAGGNYSLVANSPAAGAGSAQGTSYDGYSLVPTAQFTAR